MNTAARTTPAPMGDFVSLMRPRTQKLTRVPELTANGLPTENELARREQELFDSQPIVLRCLFCPGRPVIYRGPAGDGRTSALQHRQGEHPETLRSRRQRPSRAESRALAEPLAAQRREIANKTPSPPRADPAPSVTPAPSPITPLGRQRYARRGYWTRTTAIQQLHAFHQAHGRPPQIRDTHGNRQLPSTPTAAKLFGSWANMLEQAGFQRPHRGLASQGLA